MLYQINVKRGSSFSQAAVSLYFSPHLIHRAEISHASVKHRSASLLPALGREGEIKLKVNISSKLSLNYSSS